MPARSKPAWGALALTVLSTLAHGAAPPWPTAEMIERQKATNPFPDLGRIERAPLQALPRIPANRPALDLEEIARRHIQLRGAPAPESPALRIFVTLSMPEQSLRLLVMQAERSGATLVLRGLKANSMKQTLDRVQVLIGERRVAWQIDPETFTRFDVQHAPTFVLSTPSDAQGSSLGNCGASCMSGARFFSVAGDVSLDYALDAIVRRNPDAKGYAKPFLDRMRNP